MSAILSNQALFGEPTMKVVTVTPDLARQWLERNMGNRPVALAVVTRYAEEMKAGRWKLTGDAIRFSNSGKLIDGQHRLHAIVKAGVAITCVVMTELDDSIFNVIDIGKSRVKSDVLYIEYGLPVETVKLVASSAQLAFFYDHEMYSFKGRISNEELLSYVRQHHGLIHAAQYLREHSPHEAPVPKSIFAAFYYFASALDESRAARFVERFMVGAVDDATDNLLHLRNLCFTQRAMRRPVGVREVFGRLIKIWNSERRNKPIRHFGNTSLRQDEVFPRFI